eukprot:1105317-Heterocapsa_arctica.AAC.1
MVSAGMMPMATVCTLGRLGRPSLGGMVPLRPAPARGGPAALSAHAAQAAGDPWDHTSTDWMWGVGSSPS